MLLTSHYMADVEALCRRVIVIHHGSILFDGELARLVDGFAAHKTIVVELEDGAADLSAFGEVVESDGAGSRYGCREPRLARVTARLLAELRRRRPDRRGSADRGRDRARLRQRNDGAAIDEPRGGRRPLDCSTLRRAGADVDRQLQYRVATYFYMIGMIIEPVIYLVVWSTIAAQQGGEISGITPGRSRPTTSSGRWSGT